MGMAMAPRSKPARVKARYMDAGNHHMHRVWVSLIPCELWFPNTVNLNRLKAALDRCLCAEPILRAGYVDRWWRSFWEVPPFEPGKTGVPWLELPAGDASRVSQFLSEGLDPGERPQLRAASLLEDGRLKVWLKVNHMVADGGGVKELLALWAREYGRLWEGQEELPAENRGSRSHWQVLNRFPRRVLIGETAAYLARSHRELSGPRVVGFPSKWKGTGWVTVTHRLSAPALSSGETLRQRLHCTWNDVLVAAFGRALSGMAPESGKHLRISGTVDLRRFLPGGRGEAICNLSSLLSIELGEIAEEFATTVHRVKEQMDRIKSGPMGLDFLLGMALPVIPLPHGWRRSFVSWLFPWLKRRERIAPGMTNIGQVDPNQVRFGDVVPEHVAILSPPSVPPFFFCAASGYLGSIVLSAGVSPESIAVSQVDELFRRMDSEIAEA